MGPALIAASIAAIAAVLLSLPLRSPHDTLINSATVAIVTLLVGAGAGLVWDRLAENANRLRNFAIVMAAALVVVAIVLVALETQLERSLSFGLPLAAIAFAGTAVLTIGLDRVAALRRLWAPAVAVVAALVVGAALSGQGDAESGRLELPARAAANPTAAAMPTTASATAEPTAPPAQESGGQRTAGAYDGVTFVVSEGSEATFTVTEQLARLPLPIDAVMRTTGLSGEVYLDGRPSKILLDLHSMSSDSEFRDGYVQRRMFAGYEVATFTVVAPDPLPDGFASGNQITTQATGTLDIRDVQVPITFEIEARDDGNALFILGRTTFTWDQLSITKPTARSVVSLEDEVRVEIVLSAKPAAQ